MKFFNIEPIFIEDWSIVKGNAREILQNRNKVSRMINPEKYDRCMERCIKLKENNKK